MNNFNANEIAEIINKVQATQNDVEQAFTRIGNNFTSLSGIVASEDSKLSGTCNGINNTYRNLSGKLTQSLDAVKTALTNYAQQTLQNEAQTAQNLTETQEGLESAKSVLESL